MFTLVLFALEATLDVAFIIEYVYELYSSETSFDLFSWFVYDFLLKKWKYGLTCRQSLPEKFDLTGSLVLFFREPTLAEPLILRFIIYLSFQLIVVSIETLVYDNSHGKVIPIEKWNEALY